MTMQDITIELPNRSPMSFVGEEIAFVSTQRPGEPRWTEMRIYRTEDGAFVFRRTGRSTMYHRPDCRRIFGRMDLKVAEDPSDDGIPCDECLPDTDDEQVMLESDKEFAQRTTSPRQLVFMAQQRHRATREMTLTPLTRTLLEIACEKEPSIGEAVKERMMAVAAGE